MNLFWQFYLGMTFFTFVIMLISTVIAWKKLKSKVVALLILPILAILWPVTWAGMIHMAVNGTYEESEVDE